MAGLMATFAGIGLARFAYTPLIPELAKQGWFDSHQLAYLGAANLAGYFIGALSAHRLSELVDIKWLLRACFVSILASFILCAEPVSFSWFFVWRFVAGVSGAVLMVVAPSAVMSFVSAERQQSVATLVFTGIGLGALMSAIIIPLLLSVSLAVTWIALAGLAALAALIAEVSLHSLKSAVLTKTSQSDTSSSQSHIGKVLLLVIIAYAMDAFGFVPHTVFWVDYLAREQSLGVMSASYQWGVFGVGAICGPFIARCVLQYMSCQQSLVLAFIVKAIAVGLPLISVDVMARTLSSFIVGALIPGIVALTSARIAELVGTLDHKRFWGVATAAFALGQAVSGYAMAALYEYWGEYQQLFLIGCLAMLTGAGLIVLSSSKTEPEKSG
ncbi:MFS transporter [Endozoicomonas sp. OPT23]|nr:MFS transporter [Endozoicomonas sp. OPT23]